MHKIDDWSWTTEIFREIPGYVGYFASSLGFIWSDRKGDRRLLKDFTLKGSRSGYRQITLNGKGIYVHKLVCLAFYGHRPDGMECCHQDSCRSNCDVRNLRYGTRKSNMEDIVRSGIAKGSTAGIKNGFSRLSNENIVEIRRLSDLGLSDSRIASRLSIHRSTVYGIRTRNRWDHI